MPTCLACSFSSPQVGVPCPSHPERCTVDEGQAEKLRGDELVGRVLVQRFAMVAPLGEGGIGKVYHSIDLTTGLPAAIKVLKRERASDEETRERFKREAEAMARLETPHIVHLVDYGELPDQSGRLYIAMEMVSGDTLRVANKDGSLDGASVIAVAGGIASALAAAHAADIVHRDLKPSNVLLCPEQGAGPPLVKVVDFGLARLDVDKSHLTQTGVVFGTPAYMSPEQALGKTELTPAADVYAFGVVLYEMIAGRKPFEDDRPLVMMLAHVDREPPACTPRAGLEVGQALVDLAMECIAKAPEERPADGRVLLQRLGVDPSPQRGLAAPLVGDAGIAALGAALVAAHRAEGPAAGPQRPVAPEKASRRGRWVVVALALAGVVAALLGLRTCDDGGTTGKKAEVRASAATSDEPRGTPPAQPTPQRTPEHEPATPEHEPATDQAPLAGDAERTQSPEPAPAAEPEPRPAAPEPEAVTVLPVTESPEPPVQAEDPGRAPSEPVVRPSTSDRASDRTSDRERTPPQEGLDADDDDADDDDDDDDDDDKDKDKDEAQTRRRRHKERRSRGAKHDKDEDKKKQRRRRKRRRRRH